MVRTKARMMEPGLNQLSDSVASLCLPMTPRGMVVKVAVVGDRLIDICVYALLFLLDVTHPSLLPPPLKELREGSCP